MITVEVNNLTRLSISASFLKKISRKVLAGEDKKNFELSIVLVGQEKIQKLNHRYRGKNIPTDILSFSFNSTMGELVICPAIIKKNAKRYAMSFTKELKKVIVHGVLHLLGYDHEKSLLEDRKMRNKEQKYIC